ncbi:MAG: hypothetical protein IT370_27955 [Deltaproteobacteria bacterium]|nr:hypothetical protein [Deltaproteobacteria bacterium]
MEQPRKDDPAHEQPADVMARIKAAVAQGRAPDEADVARAHQLFGNATVTQLLAGKPDQLPQAPGIDAQGDHKIVLYARARFAEGASDLGHAFIGLEGPGQDHVYGFHPKNGAGVGAMVPGGVAGKVQVDKDQVGAGVRMEEIAVTKAQFDAAQARALKLKGGPPKYDFWAWNCVNFVADVAAAAGVVVAAGNFAGIADPEVMSDQIGDKMKAGGAPGGGDDKQKADGER